MGFEILESQYIMTLQHKYSGTLTFEYVCRIEEEGPREGLLHLMGGGGFQDQLLCRELSCHCLQPFPKVIKWQVKGRGGRGEGGGGGYGPVRYDPPREE
jgi:hypothetical protein